MSHRIARCLFEPLLRFFLPGTGRRRRTGPAVRAREDRPPVSAFLRSPIARRSDERSLRGEDHSLVRPYFVAHERRREARHRSARRRTLLLAVHGIDLGPRATRGVEAAA
ncbi:hypothetical protein [Streptomyces sp. NPDC003393]